MAYIQVPNDSVQNPGKKSTDLDIVNFLNGLANNKVFNAYSVGEKSTEPLDGFIYKNDSVLQLLGLRASGAQLFVKGFMNPDTPYQRLLIKWQTGTGKSIAAIGISLEFIKQYRLRANIGDTIPKVFIISFNYRNTIQEDMLKYPEFGFISYAELAEYKRLRQAASALGNNSNEAKILSGFSGVLRRRITDGSRGGYFQFYGYKEFANALFMVTKAGLDSQFDIQSLYGSEEGTFGTLLSNAVKTGHVIVNEKLIDELRGGLLIADEIHNVYNINESNNYGIAIQYILDVLDSEAPRAVFMSATPITGSASESIDLLNLLIPKALLPEGVPLRRSDFFIKTSYRKLANSVNESASIVSRLKVGALEKIAHLISFRYFGYRTGIEHIYIGVSGKCVFTI
jgi:hypothetical protein